MSSTAKKKFNNKKNFKYILLERLNRYLCLEYVIVHSLTSYPNAAEDVGTDHYENLGSGFTILPDFEILDLLISPHYNTCRKDRQLLGSSSAISSMANMCSWLFEGIRNRGEHRSSPGVHGQEADKQVQSGQLPENPIFSAFTVDLTVSSNDIFKWQLISISEIITIINKEHVPLVKSNSTFMCFPRLLQGGAPITSVSTGPRSAANSNL